MGYQEKIFEILGVKPNEIFYIEGRSNEYKITNDLYVLRKRQGVWYESSRTLADLLNGRLKIVKIPKKINLSKEEQIAIDYARICRCKWLAKDKNGKVYAYEEKPVRFADTWYCSCRNLPINIPISFLSWEEPYYIGGEENA